MKRQNLGDLNGYLFEQLERLNEPDMSEAELRLEFERSVRVEGVASEIVKVIEEETSSDLNIDELAYLMMHVSRLN